MIKRKQPRLSIFCEFHTFHGAWSRRVPSPILNFVFNDRLRRVVRMVDLSLDGQCVGVDLGCATGYFTQYLAQRLNGIMIGIEVSKYDLHTAKIGARLRALHENPTPGGNVEFVCADISHLPLKKNSVDLVLGVSVLEHLNDLEGTIKEIKDSLRKNGVLIAGYPIETSLFRALIRLFLPAGMTIRDPRILGKEQFEKNPDTHKQSFTTIRSLLQEHFLRIKREKSFFTVLSDQISWYECVKMKKVDRS